MIRLFQPEEEKKIIQAIQTAESLTSGEIRVHIQQKLGNKSPFEEAKRIFYRLGMHKTIGRTGVLFFLVPEERKFVILGDEGIDQKTPDDFWESIRNEMQDYFRKGEFAAGLCQGIAQVGDQLRTFFPVQANDINELKDDISYS